MAETPTPPTPVGITKDQVCALLNLGPRRITQLVADGWIKKPGGVYTITDSVHGYIGFLKDEKARLSQNTAQAEVQKARAAHINQKLAREAGELVPVEQAQALCQLVVGQMMARIAGLPARVTRDLNERARIEECVDAIRQEVVDIVAKSFEAMDADLGSLDATEEDDA